MKLKIQAEIAMNEAKILISKAFEESVP